MNELRRYLSVSDNQSSVSEALVNSIKEDEKDFPISERIDRRYRREPYRRKVVHVMKKIEYLLDALSGDKKDILEKSKKYTAEEFIADLELIKESLAENGLPGLSEQGKLQDMIIRARTFGFHLSGLDIRQHSGLHEETVSELLSQAKVIDNYGELSEDDKIEVLVQELSNPRPRYADFES